jgi:hypothetical protein
MGKRTDHAIRRLREALAETRRPDLVLAIAAGMIAAVIVKLLKAAIG